MATFDELLKTRIRAFGAWQISILLLSSIVVVPYVMVPTLAGIKPHHYCRTTAYGTSNWTLEGDIEANIPTKPKYGVPMPGQTFQPCLRYRTMYDLMDAHHSNNFSVVVETSNSTTDSANTRQTEKCYNGWVYIRSSVSFQYTLTEEFDLVCERTWLEPFSLASYMIGMLFGYVISGIMADRIGRRPTFLFFATGMTSFGFIISASTTYWMYVVCRFCIAVFANGYFCVMYTVSTELTTNAYRPLVIVIVTIVYNVVTRGIFTLVAFITQDWRLVHVALSVWALVFIVLFFYLPESPRWLITNQRWKMALKVMNLGIRINTGRPLFAHEKLTLVDIRESGATLDEAEISINSVDTTGSMYTLVEQTTLIFKTPRLLIRSLLLYVEWFALGLIYYGVTFNAVRLEGNPYFIFYATGLMSLPGIFAALIFSGRFGRRQSLIAGRISVSLFLLITCFLLGRLPKPANDNLLLAMAILTLCCTEFCATLIYTFTAELYPTVLRNISLGYCIAVQCLGSAVSTYVNSLGETVWLALPPIIYLAASLCAGLTGLFLPETRHQPLMDTLTQMNSPEETINNPEEQQLALGGEDEIEM